MESKQTPIDYIKDNLFYPIQLNQLKRVLNEAGQMHKEQMIKFAMHLHDVDMSKTGTDILMDEAEQYYNETYGKE
jgi:hypothetical protein